MSSTERSAEGSVARLLVVDDEPRITSFVSRGLRRRGFDVEEAADIAEAMARLTNGGRYELVILDLRLPDGDGVEFLSRLVEQDPEVRVLVLSALTDVDTRVRCLRIGAVDYLTKPFSLAELIARVHARLREGSPTAGDELRTQGLSLDLAGRRATGSRGTFALSEREFLLLKRLMELRGAIATREELLERIWSIDFDYSSNVVDVYVARLRTKLGPDSIETVRNVGYRVQP